MAAGLHISISAERVTEIGPLVVSNSIITSLIVTAVLVAFFLAVRASIKPKAQKPNPLQNFAEFLVEGMYNVVQGITGNHKKTRFFLPYFMSFFLFILLNNWFGLFPGVGTIGFTEHEGGVEHAVLLEKEISAPASQAFAADASPEVLSEGHEDTGDHAEAEESHGTYVPYFRPGTADLNTTLALGLFSQVIAQIMGVRYLGVSYFSKFFTLKNPILTFVGILELISEFSKVISYAFRLFGNIFAGEVLLVVLGALAPAIVPMPFYGLEIFVGLVQALVFSLLSVVFFNVATMSHDEH